MARKARKAIQIDPVATLESWIARQTDTDEARDNARDNWEPGAACYMDIVETFNGETQTTHCEQFYLVNENEEKTNNYIVVCWDDNGNITFGGM